jgi:hypothetical protein
MDMAVAISERAGDLKNAQAFLAFLISAEAVLTPCPLCHLALDGYQADSAARWNGSDIAFSPGVGPIPQLPGLVGIYFMDPNGIRLEFACQPGDGAEQKVIACNTQLKDDLRRELQTLGPGDWAEQVLEKKA